MCAAVAPVPTAMFRFEASGLLMTKDDLDAIVNCPPLFPGPRAPRPASRRRRRRPGDHRIDSIFFYPYFK